MSHPKVRSNRRRYVFLAIRKLFDVLAFAVLTGGGLEYLAHKNYPDYAVMRPFILMMLFILFCGGLPLQKRRARERREKHVPQHKMPPRKTWADER